MQGEADRASQVNPLPAEIRRIKACKIGGAHLCPRLVLAGWFNSGGWRNANLYWDNLGDRATQQDLNAKITALQPVTDLYNELTLLQDAVTTSLADQPQASLAFLRLESAAASVPGAPIEITQVSTSYQASPSPADR